MTKVKQALKELAAKLRAKNRQIEERVNKDREKEVTFRQEWPTHLDDWSREEWE